MSRGRMYTWLSVLSQTWESYQCPLRHHKGGISRTQNKSRMMTSSITEFFEASGSIAETCPVYVDLSLWMWINVDLTLD